MKAGERQKKPPHCCSCKTCKQPMLLVWFVVCFLVFFSISGKDEIAQLRSRGVWKWFWGSFMFPQSWSSNESVESLTVSQNSLKDALNHSGCQWPCNSSEELLGQSRLGCTSPLLAMSSSPARGAVWRKVRGNQRRRRKGKAQKRLWCLFYWKTLASDVVGRAPAAGCDGNWCQHRQGILWLCHEQVQWQDFFIMTCFSMALFESSSDYIESPFPGNLIVMVTSV